MKTSDFFYDLPRELIAQHPVTPRDLARMMVVDRTSRTLSHRVFRDLPDCLDTGDLLVLNNTRVLPARLFGTKAGTGGAVELLLLEELGPNRWDALLRAGSRRPAPGQIIEFHEGVGTAPVLTATVVEQLERGRVRVDLKTAEPLLAVIDRIGHPPLPPYIERQDDRASEADRAAYQTMYAREAGAVAAPTAGLHFTPEVFAALDARGIARTEITLHTGIGTFRPVTAERVDDHVMDEERYTVPSDAAEAIARTRAGGGRVVAVGSTSVRTLETVAGEDGTVPPGSGRSGLFIRPPYRFKTVDVMLTNFHLPQSTLLMMVSAFAGYDLAMEAYRVAVAEKYRFFSYGDCMLMV